MREHYQRISNLRFKDRIGSAEIKFAREMYDLYLSHLKKVICWDCPMSVRVAIYDLIDYVEKNPLQDENQTISEPGLTETGNDIEQVLTRSKGGKRSNNNTK